MADYVAKFRKKRTRARLPNGTQASDPLQHKARGFATTITSEHRVISTIFTLWPGRISTTSSSHIDERNSAAHGSGDSPAAPRLHRATSELLHDRNLNKSSASPRLPRHVPIIIPDFAQPYAPKLPRQASEAPVAPSSTPHLRRSAPFRRSAGGVKRSIPQSTSDSATENLTTIFSEVAATMNSSQVSLSASESGVEHANGSAHSLQSPDGPPVGVISPISQSGAGGANLSGLVCNVHKTTGQEPHALVGATTTILGDKLFVFGGRIHSRSRPQLTSDLYELDLIQRHWTRVDTTGDIPPPRYFHSVCALGDTMLVCYGGMSPAPLSRDQVNGAAQRQTTDTQPEVVVMSDIHILDVLSKRWHLVASSTGGSEAPQGRYAHCAAILPSSAVFTSATAPHSAIHHNRPTGDPHSGTLGVQLDGSGGAEMIVLGGQDSANNYIEQISVFNLRSLKWTSITPYDRKCGAYKSMVAPLVGLNAEDMGRGLPLDDPSKPQAGTAMLIYSNYNFLDVKLELQVRLPDGTLIERRMAPGQSPPGLRFPNGGIINSHFVVSGTFLTSAKHEYALWALDLRTLTWHQIDTAGSVFSTGSWNRGILWHRRNQFVILGHRKRNLVEDYNHRRINFGHVCMVELEAFGLYDNPRKMTPTSSYVSRSSAAVPASLQRELASNSAGGRQLSTIAEQLGQTALTISELSDMELVAMGGERISCNSQILAKSWGPFFTQLLQDSSGPVDNRTLSDATTLRENMHSQASRNSTVTITPAAPHGIASGTTVASPEGIRSNSQSTSRTLMDAPNGTAVPGSSRPRALYLPHTASTLRLLLHYLYTSSLPPTRSPLCTPHTLCSLLQMARPYQVDGLLEATVQRLHEVLDGRNAAAVFNAAAMAAGGGRATGLVTGGTLAELERRESESTISGEGNSMTALSNGTAQLRLPGGRGHQKSNSLDSTSTATTASHTDTESSTQDSDAVSRDPAGRGVWSGEMSSVIGLQKRGLRGLMEGRRLRERATATAGADA